jgi:2-keto-4-pentenoate hydratase
MKRTWIPVTTFMFTHALVAQAIAAPSKCEADPARLAGAVTAFYERRAQQALPLELEQARCFQQAFVKELAKKQGSVVGYKVGLYTTASRKTFGASAPEIGTMLKGMMLDGSREIPASLGFSPVAEADFVLVVRDDRINEAKTREEFYRHLRGYRPFVELPDNNYPAGAPVSAGQLVALNVNARAGVVGEEKALQPTEAGFAALAGLS